MIFNKAVWLIFFISSSCVWAVMWGLQAFGKIIGCLLDWPWWKRTVRAFQSHLQHDR